MVIEVYPGLWPGWESLAPDAPFLASYRWLRAREGRTDGPTFTFVAEVEGAPAAGLYATLVPDSSTDEVFNLPKLLAGTPRTILLNPETRQRRERLQSESPEEKHWFPNLVVVYPGYECFPIGSQATSEAVVDELVAEIVDWARRQGARAVSFLYTSPENKLLDDVLNNRGFLPIHLTYTCDLNLKGESFEDYLRMLPHKRRGEVRRELRRIRDLGISTVSSKIADRYEDLVRLGLAHSRKYGRRVSEEKERGKLDKLLENFGEELMTVYCASSDGVVLAFGLFLEYLGVWYALDSGSDHEDERSRYLYFDTNYYTPITQAYSKGIRKIRYSAATWEAKSNRGCDLIPREAWFLPLTPELQTPIKRAAELFPRVDGNL